tara:strand:- start:43 stop:345 length:303 start_codon:yes stop_codon:yes gene_type:complete
MNLNGNPILIELAEQLPPNSKIYKLIMTGTNYPLIIGQAKEDFFCFGDMENEVKDGMKGINILKQNGYEEWLHDKEDDDRLRICGVLQMISELSEELNDE